DKPEPRVMPVTSRLVGDALQALASEVLVPEVVEQPAWLDEREEPNPRGLIVCRNGIVSLADWAAGRPCLLPLTQELFTTVALPCDFDLGAPPPALWLEFLEKLWRNDPESIALLQEWFGYCLTDDTSQQKILLVVGPPRAGKGTIIRIQTELV